MKLCLIVLNKSTNLIFVNYLGVTKITMSVNDNTPSVEAAALIYEIIGTESADSVPLVKSSPRRTSPRRTSPRRTSPRRTSPRRTSPRRKRRTRKRRKRKRKTTGFMSSPTSRLRKMRSLSPPFEL